MIPLGLGVRGLLLVVVHGLLVVRPAVLLQSGLGQIAVAALLANTTTTTESRQTGRIVAAASGRSSCYYWLQDASTSTTAVRVLMMHRGTATVRGAGATTAA